LNSRAIRPFNRPTAHSLHVPLAKMEESHHPHDPVTTSLTF
jgi:hypothetical protein